MGSGALYYRSMIIQSPNLFYNLIINRMNENILSKLIGFNTVSSNSNLELIAFAKEKFSGLDYKIRVLKKGDKANLFAFKQSSKRIILSAHTDTVPLSGQWPTNPLTLVKKGGKYTGLGVCDMKIFIAIMFDLAEKFSKQNNLAFLLTFDEESNLAGSKLVDSTLIKKDDIIIIGEPTDSDIILNTKGAIACRGKFIGKSGHGSDPNRGISAIEDVAKFIELFKKDFLVVSKKYDNPLFKIPKTTLNYGIISGGQAVNKIADEAELVFETRINSLNQLSDLKKIANTVSKQLRGKFQLAIELILEPFYASEKLRQLLEKTGSKIAPGVSFATEATIFHKLTDKIIIFGPGNIKQAHQTDEYILIKSVKNYEKRLSRLLNILTN
jgi:acetylornithine deacetylase